MSFVLTLIVTTKEARIGVREPRFDRMSQRGAVKRCLRRQAAIRRKRSSGRHGESHDCDDGSHHRETKLSARSIQSFKSGAWRASGATDRIADESTPIPASRLPSPSFNAFVGLLLIRGVRSASIRRQATDMEGTIPFSFVTVTH